MCYLPFFQLWLSSDCRETGGNSDSFCQIIDRVKYYDNSDKDHGSVYQFIVLRFYVGAILEYLEWIKFFGEEFSQHNRFVWVNQKCLTHNRVVSTPYTNKLVDPANVLS